MALRPNSVRVLVSLVLAATLAVASPLSAQQPLGARLDLTLGGGRVRGGVINHRTNGFADVLGAGRVRRVASGAIVAGLGVSAIAGGFGDSCLLLPNGGCAGKGNFMSVTAVLGVDRSVGGGSLRLLAGPSYHDGAKERSVGLQGRIDVASPAFAHAALGLMTRATVLPSHGDATLIVWGVGVGVAFR